MHACFSVHSPQESRGKSASAGNPRASTEVVQKCLPLVFLLHFIYVFTFCILMPLRIACRFLEIRISHWCVLTPSNTLYLVFTLRHVPASTGCARRNDIVLLSLRAVSESRAFSKDFLSDCFLTCVARFTFIYYDLYSSASREIFPRELESLSP